jgi:hypothetical protein
MDLPAKFVSLKESDTTGGESMVFFTQRISDKSDCRIAKTTEGFPCLIVPTSSEGSRAPAPLQLEHLTVQHGLRGNLRTDEHENFSIFSLAILRSTEAPLLNSFLRLSEALAPHLASSPTSEEVARAVMRFADLLQRLKKPAAKTIQGLWAELLVLTYADKPRDWVRAWHSDPRGLHDFDFGQFRVEVKSSSRREREHSFSHDQLCGPPGVDIWVASLFVDRTNGGQTVFDLVGELAKFLDADSLLIVDDIVLRTLGDSYSKAESFRFDRGLADDSLRFFRVCDVPKLANIPSDIHDIAYTSRLDASKGLRSLPTS